MTPRTTLVDIATALNITKQAVAQRARREDWPYEQESVRGGKRRTYLPAELPADVRTALLDRALTQVSPSPAAVAAVSPAGVSHPAPAALFAEADLTDRQRRVRDARTGVLAAVRRLQADTGCSQEAALTTLLTNASAGRLDEHTLRMVRLARDPRGRSGDGIPSLRSAKRWLAAKDLAPKKVQADYVPPPWAKAFLAVYQQPQKPSVDAAYRDACRHWSAEERPSIHQVRRFLARLGAVTRERGRMGPRELKSIQPFVRRTFDQLLPNDIWTADGHTFDAEVQHPLHGRPFRPEITLILDVATRRAVGWSVGLAENTFGVIDALRGAVQQHGSPAIAYFDRGAGFRNAALADEATGLLARIGCELRHSLPYNSQARGVIERAHQSIWVAGAKGLPAYVGAAMDREARLEHFKTTRRAIKAGGALPLLPWHVFVAWCDEQVARYNAAPHKTLKGSSPDLVWRDFEARGWQPVRLAEGELDSSFRPRVVRKLARAEIRLFNNIYFARELEEFHGMEAHIAYDIHDASTVWVHTPDGRLICEAAINGNAKHYFPVPVIEQAREKRAKGRLKRVDAKREEIIAEMHGAPAIEAPRAQHIVIGGRVLDADALTLEGAARVTAVEKATEIAAPVTAVTADITPRSRSERSAEENYADWRALDARIEAGVDVSEADARWHRTYPTSAQYKALVKKMAACAGTQTAVNM